MLTRGRFGVLAASAVVVGLVLTVPVDAGARTRLRRTTTTTSTTIATTSTTTAAPAPTTVERLFHTGYDALAGSLAAVPPWQSEQEPVDDGVRQTSRIRIVSTARGNAMRVELRPYESASGLADGDVFSGTNRAEVYARHASPSTTPPELWPDPVGSTRWYGFDLFVPSDFVTDTTGQLWFTLTQWKGLAGGSPPIALEIKNDRLEMAGATGRQSLGTLRKGTWERIVVGVHFQPTTAGWVEVYRDGAQVLPRTYRPTMGYRTVDGVKVLDPSYLKQGIYRTKSWKVTHVLYFGPTSIGRTKADVA